MISRFGIPTSLIFDNATYFSSLILYNFTLVIGIILKHSTTYYLQGNGLPESMKKNLNNIMKETIFSE